MFYKVIFWVSVSIAAFMVVMWLLGMVALCQAFRPSAPLITCIMEGPNS